MTPKRPRLDDVLTADERLDLWAEMMALAAAMQEYCDWWWRLDTGLRRANRERADAVDSRQLSLPKISD